MSGRNRSDSKAGTLVQVVQKQDQLSGKQTEGIVKNILTKSDPIFTNNKISFPNL